MERDAYIVVFDELECEKEETYEDKAMCENNPPSYYLFNEILKNSTITIPVYSCAYDKCPDHVIMVISLGDIESKEDIIPSYWESYIYWQYTSVKFGINSDGLRKVVISMFHWFMKMEKMPYFVVTGFKDDDDNPSLSKIDIISCLVRNGLPGNQIFFINDGKCRRDVLVIEELAKTIEKNIVRK